MAAHAVALALEEDGLTIHHPSGTLAHVAALRDRMNLTTFSADDALIRVWVTTIGDIAQYEPLAVGAPFEVETSVLIIPLAAISHLRHVHGLQIDHLQFDTVFDEGYLLAVGTIFRRATLYL